MDMISLALAKKQVEPLVFDLSKYGFDLYDFLNYFSANTGSESQGNVVPDEVYKTLIDAANTQHCFYLRGRVDSGSERVVRFDLINVGYDNLGEISNYSFFGIERYGVTSGGTYIELRLNINSH